MYVREFDGEPHDFGVIGVEEGTLIMYDRQTGSWWSQLLGEAVQGEMKGERLDRLPSTMTTWKKWQELHPETTVYVKPSIPYRPRFTADSFAEIASAGDGPLQNEDWVIALEGHVKAHAYPARRLAQQRLLNDHLEGRPIAIYLSDDLATVKVWNATVAGQELSFRLVSEELLVDEQTGTTWNPLSGEAARGELAGERLQPLISTYSLWFAWKKYRPDTMVWGEAAGGTGGKGGR